MKYFKMLYADELNYKPYGVAYSSPDIDAFLLPPSGVTVKSWDPIALSLKDGEFADFLSNDIGGRLCSEPLKKIIDTLSSSKDKFQWLETSVNKTNADIRKYFILHFDENFPVVNLEHSLISGDMIIKAVLDRNAVKEHGIFTLPNEAGRTIFVSERIKTAIESAELSGMSFSDVSLI
jgi:hypothetical protein